MVYFKRILTIFTIFLLFTYNSFAYDGVDYTYSDNNMNIYNDYESLCRDFLSRISVCLQSDNVQKVEMGRYLANRLKAGYFVYVWRGALTDTNTIDGDTMVSNRLYRPRYISFFLYRTVTTYTPHDNLSYQGYDGTIWNTAFYDITCTYSQKGQFSYNDPYVNEESGSQALAVCLPRILITYTPSCIQTFKDNYSDDLTNQQIIELLNDILDETEELNDFLQDTTIQQGSIDMTGVDSFSYNAYDNKIDQAYNIIVDAFSNPSSTNLINLTIPFCHKTIHLDTSFLHNLLNSYEMYWITNIIAVWWWYFFCKKIIYDILKIVQAISSGDFVTNKTDSLITVDML